MCCLDSECGSNSWRLDTFPAASTKHPSACQETFIYPVAFTFGSACVCVCTNSHHKDMFLLFLSLTTRDFNQTAAHLHTHPPLSLFLLFFSVCVIHSFDVIFGLSLPSLKFINVLSSERASVLKIKILR